MGPVCSDLVLVVVPGSAQLLAASPKFPACPAGSLLHSYTPAWLLSAPLRAAIEQFS